MVQGTIKTQRPGLYTITEPVMNAIEASKVKEGLCVVFTTSIEASILMASKGDSRIYEDILDDYNRVFPPRTNYEFMGKPESSAAHSKSALAGVTLDVIIREGKACLGEHQEILLADYIGEKECTWMVQCIGR